MFFHFNKAHVAGISAGVTAALTEFVGVEVAAALGVVVGWVLTMLVPNRE